MLWAFLGEQRFVSVLWQSYTSTQKVYPDVFVGLKPLDSFHIDKFI